MSYKINYEVLEKTHINSLHKLQFSIEDNFNTSILEMDKFKLENNVLQHGKFYFQVTRQYDVITIIPNFATKEQCSKLYQIIIDCDECSILKYPKWIKKINR
jgi:hypothetical protein